MNIWRHMAVLGGFSILALLMTAPVASHMTSHLAGEGGDPWQTLWRFEEKATAFSESRSTNQESSFLEREFFGGGEPRLVNLSVWPWMPVHAVLGQPITFNTVWLLSFVLSGYCMFLLVRFLVPANRKFSIFNFSRFGRDSAATGQFSNADVAAFLAGMFYMFLPFHVAHSFGHFGAMQTQWLPLAILLLFLWVKRPTIWRTLGLAAVLVVQAWTEHHYMLWCAVFTVIALVLWSARSSRILSSSESRITNSELSWRRVMPYLVLLGSLLFFFVVLPYVPTIKLAFTPETSLALGPEQTIRFSADLFSYVTPAGFQPIWGGIFSELFSKYFTGNVSEATQYLGIVPLLLVVFFRQHIPRRQKWFWGGIAILFFVISLGPRLHIFGRILPVPLPYAGLAFLPVFDAVRAVARAGVVVGLSTSIMLAWVLQAQIRRQGSAILLGGVILLEFLFLPVPIQSVNLSAAYQAVAQTAGSTILEIPAATNYTVASKALYASLQHGKTSMGNIALERAETAEDFEEAKSLPALRQLLFLRTGHLREDRQEFFDQNLAETFPDVAAWIDVDSILVYTDSISPLQLASTRDFLEKDLNVSATQYEDDLLYTFSIAELQQRHGSDGVFLARDGRWEHVGYDPKRDSVFAEIPERAGLTLYNVTDKTIDVVLELIVEQGGVQLGGSVANAGQTMQHHMSLTPGRHTLEVVSGLPERAIIRNPRLYVTHP